MMEICDVDFRYQLLAQEPGGIYISQYSSGTSSVSPGIAIKKFSSSAKPGRWWNNVESIFC